MSRPPEVSVNFPDTAERLTAEAVVHRGRGAFERLSGFERRLLAFDLDNPGTGVTAAAAALGCPFGTVGPTRTRTNAKLRRAREFAAHTSVA